MSRSIDYYAQVFLGLFLLFAIAHLAALATAGSLDNYLTKPLLMFWLGGFVYARLRALPTPSAHLLLLGLCFSMIGDTLLLFADSRPAGSTFFLLGLSSFLLTHVSYWLSFHHWPKRQAGLLARRPWWALPFMLYGLAMLYGLWPGLPPPMRLPVALYSAVILLMAGKALHLSPNLSAPYGSMLVSGAGLFVLSDTIIALSRFTGYLPVGSWATATAIMLTYLAGQLLICLALARPPGGSFTAS